MNFWMLLENEVALIRLTVSVLQLSEENNYDQIQHPDMDTTSAVLKYPDTTSAVNLDCLWT